MRVERRQAAVEDSSGWVGGGTGGQSVRVKRDSSMVRRDRTGRGGGGGRGEGARHTYNRPPPKKRTQPHTHTHPCTLHTHTPDPPPHTQCAAGPNQGPSLDEERAGKKPKFDRGTLGLSLTGTKFEWGT